MKVAAFAPGPKNGPKCSGCSTRRCYAAWAGLARLTASAPATPALSRRPPPEASKSRGKKCCRKVRQAGRGSPSAQTEDVDNPRELRELHAHRDIRRAHQCKSYEHVGFYAVLSLESHRQTDGGGFLPHTCARAKTSRVRTARIHAVVGAGAWRQLHNASLQTTLTARAYVARAHAVRAQAVCPRQVRAQAVGARQVGAQA